MFYYISKIVDPDNDYLIEAVKTKLGELNIKNFGYSARSMIAEFKNLVGGIEDLDGIHSEDEQFLDFGKALKTMKESKSANFVETEHDTWRKQDRANRDPIQLI